MWVSVSVVVTLAVPPAVDGNRSLEQRDQPSDFDCM